MEMLDKIIYNLFAGIDKLNNFIGKLFEPKKQKKKNVK